MFFSIIINVYFHVKIDLLNIFSNIFNNDIFNNNKLTGGSTEIGDIQSQIRNDEEEIKRMKMN